MTSSYRFLISSPLDAETIVRRLRDVTITSWTFRLKGKMYRGRVSVRDFKLLPLSGGDYSPEFLGAVTSCNNEGTKISLERRLHAAPYIAFGLIVVLGLLVLTGEFSLPVLVVIAALYAPIHYAGYRYATLRSERQLCELLEATAVTGSDPTLARRRQVCRKCQTEFLYYRDRCPKCNHSVSAGQKTTAAWLLSIVLAIAVIYVVYTYTR